MMDEKTGFRDMSYSVWHRVNSIGRYVDRQVAASLGMIDVDNVLYIEYDRDKKLPLALVETVRYTNEADVTAKGCYILQNLARMAYLPAMVVAYEIDKTKPLHCDAKGAGDRAFDIIRFYKRRLFPLPHETRFTPLTPEGYCATLLKIRECGKKMIKERGFPFEFPDSSAS